MGLDAVLADNWGPTELVLIGITIGMFLTLVIAITEGLNVPQQPQNVVASVLVTLALIFATAGVFSWKNNKQGTGWRYVGDD